MLVPPGIDDRTIASTVLRLKADNGYTIDTHGATALAAALATAPAEAPKLVFATGHPAKNLDIMPYGRFRGMRREPEAFLQRVLRRCCG